ncbi:MAG TPA: rod shape-determining protein MreC [Ferruginibacter sp.]|nr:rod shape-determining protein MreC [Ferruginibacter sp.]
MRNIFLFIRRYVNLILFLSLQALSIYLIVHYSSYQNAIASESMNEITGRANTQFNNVSYYFALKSTNDSLVKANAVLYNKLKSDFEFPDTINKVSIDSIKIDSVLIGRKYLYKEAKVVANSVSSPTNYLVLGRGANQHLVKDIGVVDPNNCVVGIITDVSSNFAVVMSLLHKDSKISAKLKKGGDAGTVTWDGHDPTILTLSEIRKSAKVAKGDTVLTSGYTTTFPYGLTIGTIQEIIPEKSTSRYTLKLKTAANFSNLQYVYAIDNLQKDEINRLLEKAKKESL